ncbi:MAG: FAD-binding oxidoreductase, partial [Nitrospirales bacterium]
MPDKTSAVAGDLRRTLGTDKVRDDVPTRIAYAVDASIYKLVPLVVVLAESEDDIEAVVQHAQRTGTPVTPRAAGTNLTGSAIGTGIILDVSRMNRVLAVDRERRLARVQPGVVFAELNTQLASSGLMFGPDPSSGEMCKLGGMLANNSSGPHTLRYGSVKDNVEALRIRLPTSGWLDTRAYPLGGQDLAVCLRTHPELAEILDLVRAHADLIESKRPRVSKNSCGYNLFGLVDGLATGSF